MSNSTGSNYNRLAVYFDNSCPLCRKEIAFYQHRKGADGIDWVDVSQPDNAPDELSCAQAMARFHVRTTDGRLVDGGKAFVELWMQLKAFRWLGMMFSLPVLRSVIDWAYDAFLPLRPRLQRLMARA